jgi:hypothetical protein
MTGRHAAADDVDDQQFADHPHQPGAHAAEPQPTPTPTNTDTDTDADPVDPQGELGDGSVPADADLQAATPDARPRGRRARGAAL